MGGTSGGLSPPAPQGQVFSCCNAPPPRSPGAFVYEPVGREPFGSTKKRVTHTAKRTIVIQIDRCAFKTRNSSLTRPFCSNRLLFGDGDDGGGGHHATTSTQLTQQALQTTTSASNCNTNNYIKQPKQATLSSNYNIK